LVFKAFGDTPKTACRKVLENVERKHACQKTLVLQYCGAQASVLYCERKHACQKTLLLQYCGAQASVLFLKTKCIFASENETEICKTLIFSMFRSPKVVNASAADVAPTCRRPGADLPPSQRRLGAEPSTPAVGATLFAGGT
jgi:hypothetical protein